MLQKAVVLGFLATATSELLLNRYTSGFGGHQSISQTSTDYIPHICTNYTHPVVVHACGADTSTGGNPGPLDPATPMNVIQRCGTSLTLICAAKGDSIGAMCCQAVLPDGVNPQCDLIIRVFNGGATTTTLVTSMVDIYPALTDDLKRIPRALMTEPMLPPPPNQVQVRTLLTSVATLSPIVVPFNDRRRVMVDLAFDYCGVGNRPVTFGITGTTLSAESEVFVCETAMGAFCGNQRNHGTDGIVTVFHSVTSLPLVYGGSYFIRLFSYGHEGTKPTIEVVIGNTVTESPPHVLENYLARYAGDWSNNLWGKK